MTGDTAWIEEARRLYADGTPVTAIFRMLGQTDYAVRMALDIDGYRERKREQAVAQKARYKLAREAGAKPRTKFRDRTKPVEEPAPAKPKVTLHALRFLAKPIDEAPPPVRRIAPKTHCCVEQAGVATIREIHHRMIRAGKVSAHDMEMIS